MDKSLFACMGAGRRILEQDQNALDAFAMCGMTDALTDELVSSQVTLVTKQLQEETCN